MTENHALPPSRCGFVSFIGLTNAGKSTLLNSLVGSKVSIVSRKVQTTRQRILGIALHDQAQIIFIDAPGIFSAKTALEKTMIENAWSALDEGQVIAHIIDVSRPDPLGDNDLILKRLQDHQDKPTFLILNKIDKIEKSRLLDLTKALNDRHPYAQTFMISALHNRGTDKLLACLGDALPRSEWIFPEDQVSDAPMRFLAAEITREKIYDQLHKELPYSIFVETEHWENFDNGDVKIMQLIYVEKDSQKSIVLGKGGRQIQKIGQTARLELEDVLQTKVHLKLQVKVKPKWREQSQFLQRLLSHKEW